MNQRAIAAIAALSLTTPSAWRRAAICFRYGLEAAFFP